MRLLSATAVLVAILTSVAGVATSAPVEMLPVSQIKPGMEGVGFTVFSGNSFNRMDFTKKRQFKVYRVGGIFTKYASGQAVTPMISLAKSSVSSIK